MQSTPKTDEIAIRSLLNQVLVAFNEGDIEKAISLHTENVVLMESNMPEITGRKAMKELFEAYFERSRKNKINLQLGFDVLELEITGSRGFVRGKVMLTSTKEGDAPSTNNGKFLCLFQKQGNGTWLRSHIVSNSDSTPVSLP